MPVFLTLGDVTFENYEIPETIPFGGDQMLSIKRSSGGKRKIDSMGPDDRDITWKGRFRGSTGLFRARYVDGLRRQGKKVNLTWSEFNYSVVIKNFNPNFERYYEIPYSITVSVIQDLNNPFSILLPAAYDDAIDNMLAEANDLANAIANPSVSSALALLSETINGIDSLANASSSALTTITGPLNSCLNATGSAISSTSSALFG